MKSVQCFFQSGVDWLNFGVVKWFLFTMTLRLLGPMVKIRPFNRLTWSFCTTSSKPITSALATGVQFPNAFSDPTDSWRTYSFQITHSPYTRLRGELEHLKITARSLPLGVYPTHHGVSPHTHTIRCLLPCYQPLLQTPIPINHTSIFLTFHLLFSLFISFLSRPMIHPNS